VLQLGGAQPVLLRLNDRGDLTDLVSRRRRPRKV
jgi:hypothetical protein